MTERLIIHECPPGCRCEHTLTCSGKCKLGPIDCGLKHANHVCGHRWGDELVKVGERSRSVVCVNCGLDAMSHDLMYGP